MTKINEILTLDLNEDIKNVIDLEDRSELEIQQEIESYIVTEGIGRHLYNFTNQFTSNIIETGVWLSGFYGSGKSYFGKMLGYIIDNPIINGTPVRERFLPRIKGVSDESLLENAIRNLESKNSRVVFLDVAKQNTDRGLAFTLFANLLKNLGFRDDIYGYMEFDLFLEDKLEEFKNLVKTNEGKEWGELKTSNRQVAKVMRNTFSLMGYSDDNYSDTQKVYSSAIDGFSASKFKDELNKYLIKRPDETLVFVFDEASEAISQNKFTLLDLEGISEALSSINNQVWTIAIAQEKLDDVINNTNVNRSQLTKVTDRFKTKIHLESTEVDVIIRSRLLQKNKASYQQLVAYFQKNEGLVSDATNLKSSFPTKTNDADEFATYYPFHRYQFDILQKFLFSSNALVATQIAARGMIITTFDVLRKQLKDKELYSFTPGHSICSEAQTAPPIGLVNKYDTAKKIMQKRLPALDGELILKTIHLLSDSDVVSATVENITKSYISDLKSYYAVKPVMEEALTLLVDAKVLLLSNNNYKITSDLEGKLLEEMKEFDIELFSKKRSLINYLKSYKIFQQVSSFNDGTGNYKFSILSDQDDELTGAGDKQLRLVVYSLFNLSENRQDFIENIKLETQYHKDLITLIPDNTNFSKIDRLIGDISRYKYMEEKYSNEADSAKRQIIRDFSIMREEKEKELRAKINEAYHNSSLVYLFDDYRLNEASFKGTIIETEQKLVKNIYTKRLVSSISEVLVTKVFSNRKEKLGQLFSGDDFRFFDSHGNFTGDHLKVVEEINAQIKTRYVDGRTLESDLSGAPWGYSFGTIVTTLAVLLRAGRLSVKYNGNTWFSHEKNGIQDAFTNATRFKSASFKSISATLSATQKNLAVQLLMDLEIEKYTNIKMNWNINDFELAESIRAMAEHFRETLITLSKSIDGFYTLLPAVAEQKQILLSFDGKVSESNYIEKVEYLIDNRDLFSNSVNTIIKAQRFLKKNFSKVKEFKRFMQDVTSELKKADRQDTDITEAQEEFTRLYKKDMVKNFSQLQQQAQITKDSYYKLLKNAAEGMSHSYQLLNGKVDAAQRTLKKYPEEPNRQNQKKLNELKRYCSDRVIEQPVLEYSITCKNCGFSLSDILNYSALALNKETDLQIIESSFIQVSPQPEPQPDKQPEKQPHSQAGSQPGSQLGTERDEKSVTATKPTFQPVAKPPRKIRLQVPTKVMTVKEYRSLLTRQLTSLASARPEEEIELDIEV